MIIYPLNRGHYIWLGVALCIAAADLYFRVWSPLTLVDKEWQSTELPSVVATNYPTEALIKQLQSYQQSAADNGQMQNKTVIPADAKQIGEYYLELYAIYKLQQQYVAILSVQPKDATSVKSKLLHWKLAEGNQDLTVASIDQRTISIQQGTESVTLQLFENK